MRKGINQELQIENSYAKTKECPKCKSQITIDNFDWHLKNGHNKYFEDDEKYEDDDLSLDEVDFLQKNIDATKDYGYPCREGGMYGSLPGYDGFADESEAYNFGRK